jgi:hypothetical protein
LAVLTCGWVTVKSDRCHYTHRHSSVGGTALGQDGAPAYEASAQAFWSLRFERNGAPIQIAGAKSELPGRLMTTAVEVAEVQTIVTGTG